MEQREFIVEAEGAGQRIDRFLISEDRRVRPAVGSISLWLM